MKIKAKEFSISFPFDIGGEKFVANEAGQRAAWALYFEFSTRVTQRSFDQDHSRLRAALSSLHSLFGITREILRNAELGCPRGEQWWR